MGLGIAAGGFQRLQVVELLDVQFKVFDEVPQQALGGGQVVGPELLEADERLRQLVHQCGVQCRVQVPGDEDVDHVVEIGLKDCRIGFGDDHKDLCQLQQQDAGIRFLQCHFQLGHERRDVLTHSFTFVLNDADQCLQQDVFRLVRRLLVKGEHPVEQLLAAELQRD